MIKIKEYVVKLSLVCTLLLGACKKDSQESNFHAIDNDINFEVNDLYPFSVGFGASLSELIKVEGPVVPSTDVDFLAIYDYDREWKEYRGTLRYLYLKQEDIIAAVSFNILLDADVFLDNVLGTAERIYGKATAQMYEDFFELEASEAQRLFDSEEHRNLFIGDKYMINIVEDSEAGIINILYSYIHTDNNHRH